MVKHTERSTIIMKKHHIRSRERNSANAIHPSQLVAITRLAM